MIEVFEQQREKIREYVKLFKDYSKSEDYIEDVRDRKERETFFSEVLKREKIASMDDYIFGEIISKLWASRIWTNKEYLVQKIISKNGIERIKKEFNNLLYGNDPFEERFEKFMKNIKGIGPASITEILCFFNPNEYGIWNDKARKALKILGFDKILPLNKYKISGKEYQKFNQLLKLIAHELKNEGFTDADLLLVDYFLYEVWKTESIEIKKPPEPFKPEKYDFDHDEIRDFIRDIGLWLGFEAETEKTISYGARVDVIWRAKIANLGVVTYVFEVHKSGSIDSLILNLQKAKRNPTVQKIIAVSDKKQLEKIKKEVEGLPEDFRKSLSLWDAEEVEKTHEKLSEVIKIIEKLELVKSEFGD